MDFAALPLAAFDSPEFHALPWGAQRFLLDLYIVFYDVERFTIDASRPEDYRQSPGVAMCRRINELLRSGLLICEAQRKKGICHKERIFRFKHPTGQVKQAA